MNANSIGAPVSATPATPATTDNEYDRISSSRRALLIGAAILPLSACPAPAPAAPSASDPMWDRLLAAYNAAEAEQLTCHAAFMVRERAWDAAAPARTTRPTPPPSPRFDHSMTLDEIHATTAAPEWKTRWAAYEAEVQAWDERNRAAHNAALGGTEKAWEDADGAAAVAFHEVRNYPVASLSALAEKAEAMTERYGNCLEADDALSLIADIRRLAGREA